MTHPLLPLRPYQEDAVDRLLADLDDGVEWPAVIMPTGGGKTVIFSHAGKRYRDRRGHGQIVVTAHRGELLSQAADKVRAVAPGLSVGIVAANRNEAGADVVCASVQTLARGHRLDMIPDPALVIVDECHHAAADTYQAMIGRFVAKGAKVCGFTATMSRGDGRALGATWTKISAHRSIAEMIAGGYLVRPRGERVRVEGLDLNQVKRAHGDFSQDALGEALEQSLAPEAIAKAIMERCSDEQGIIFTPTVSSARAVVAALEDAALPVALIHGAMSTEARQIALEAFRAGSVRWLANCMVLTEGTDLPMASVCVIARPTSSVGLYVQMVGRVLRPAPGKARALILDVVGATTKHRLSSPVDLFGDERERAEMEEQGIELDDVLDLDVDTELDDLLGQDVGPTGANGPLTFREVDLFRGSTMDWQSTELGVMFLPAGDRYLVVQPGPIRGEWEVLDMHKTLLGTGRMIERGIPDLGYALAWADAQITQAERMTAARDRSWKRQKASDRSERYARSLGIDLPIGAKGGEVSALIEKVLATRRIDRWVPFYVRVQLIARK